jgi:hypothetical protein
MGKQYGKQASGQSTRNTFFHRVLASFPQSTEPATQVLSSPVEQEAGEETANTIHLPLAKISPLAYRERSSGG